MVHKDLHIVWLFRPWNEEWVNQQQQQQHKICVYFRILTWWYLAWSIASTPSLCQKWWSLTPCGQSVDVLLARHACAAERNYINYVSLEFRMEVTYNNKPLSAGVRNSVLSKCHCHTQSHTLYVFFSNFRSQCVFSSIIIQIQNSTLHITDNNSTQDRLLMRRALHYEALNKCVCVCDVPLAPVKFVCPWENCAVLRECVCVCVSATSAISKKLIWFIQEMIQHNGTYNLF